MNQQEIKQYMSQWIRENRALDSSIGRIELEEHLLGEGGTALVYASEFAGGSAVKILAEDVSADASVRYQRFISEYANLLRLSLLDSLSHSIILEFKS